VRMTPNNGGIPNVIIANPEVYVDWLEAELKVWDKIRIDTNEKTRIIGEIRKLGSSQGMTCVEAILKAAIIF